MIYVLKRLVLFIPTLWVISVLTFWLSRMGPGDPVTRLCPDPFSGERDVRLDYERALKEYYSCAQLYGLDRPAFYFSLHTAAHPDTLHRLIREDLKQTSRRLIRQYGNWPEIQAFHRAVRQTEAVLPNKSVAGPRSEAIRLLRQLVVNSEPVSVQSLIQQLDSLQQDLSDTLLAAGWSPFAERQKTIQHAWKEVQTTDNGWQRYWPKLSWHGVDNQYHRWLSGFVIGDWGISWSDRQPVAQKIGQALRWTLLLSILSLFLAFGFAIPMGVWMAGRAGSWWDQLGSLGLFMLYSLPVFWVGTLLLVFFTTPEYGMKWFPSGGLGEGIADGMWHLVLPVFCLTYGVLAIIARQMREGMLEVLKRPFIRTAYAKGLPRSRVLWKHVFRNALFPIITLLASVFPRLIAGSLVVEFIFDIPGMGWLTYYAIVAEDWNVVFAVVFLSALLTMVGILVADLLYSWTDPRVRLGAKRST